MHNPLSFLPTLVRNGAVVEVVLLCDAFKL